MASGIYEIVNSVSGRIYVGSAVNLKRREAEHFSRLDTDEHPNVHLQRSWKKYGANTFEFRVVLECPIEELVEREQERIDSYDFDELYNIQPTAGSALGVKHSAEVRTKNSAVHMGHAVSEATRAKLSVAHTGRRLSDEHREKLSAAKIGRPKSDEHRAKMSGPRKGRVVSDATRAKLSAAARNPSPETRAKLSAAKMGHPKSNEHRANISAARMGLVFSDETRARMSASAKARWAKKKGV